MSQPCFYKPHFNGTINTSIMLMLQGRLAPSAERVQFFNLSTRDILHIWSSKGHPKTPQAQDQLMLAKITAIRDSRFQFRVHEMILHTGSTSWTMDLKCSALF